MGDTDGTGSKYTGASNSSTAKTINPECNPSCNSEKTFTKQKTLKNNSLLVRTQQLLELTSNMMFC